MWGRRLYKGRFFGIHAFGVPWEADGKEIMCDVSPSASQADLSKKPTLVKGRPSPLNFNPDWYTLWRERGTTEGMSRKETDLFWMCSINLKRIIPGTFWVYFPIGVRESPLICCQSSSNG
jgi:hypothetical protein